jgi:hypothetical protein
MSSPNRANRGEHKPMIPPRGHRCRAGAMRVTHWSVWFARMANTAACKFQMSQESRTLHVRGASGISDYNRRTTT